MSALHSAAKAGVPVTCGTCGHEFPQDPPFSVSCPKCHAAPGSYCIRPSGHSGPMIDFHADRDLAALADGFYNHKNDQGFPCGRQSYHVSKPVSQCYVCEEVLDVDHVYGPPDMDLCRVHHEKFYNTVDFLVKLSVPVGKPAIIQPGLFE